MLLQEQDRAPQLAFQDQEAPWKAAKRPAYQEQTDEPRLKSRGDSSIKHCRSGSLDWSLRALLNMKGSEHGSEGSGEPAEFYGGKGHVRQLCGERQARVMGSL